MKKLITMFVVCAMFLFPFSGLMARDLLGSDVSDSENPVEESVEGMATTESKEPEASAVLNIIKENPNFSRFAEFLEASDLDTILGDIEGMTLFVPSNEALSESEADGAVSIEDADTLIRKHIVSKAMNFDDLLSSGELTTLDGAVLPARLEADAGLSVGDVTVTGKKNLGNDTIAVYPVSGVIGQGQ